MIARGSEATTAQEQLPFALRQPQKADERKAEAERLIERAIPVAQELGRRVGRIGVTVGNLRLALASRGIITGHERGKGALSWIGRVFARADFKATALFRRSVVKATHGVPNRVWVLPEFYDDALHGEPAALPDNVLRFLRGEDSP